MKIDELKCINRVKIDVDKSIYQYDQLIEIRSKSAQVCESCLTVGKLWIPEEDAVIGLCDECLIKSYGSNNIMALPNN